MSEHFTSKFVDWKPWINAVEEATASDEQKRLVGGSAMRSSNYAKTCAHDPLSFRARSQMNQAIIYAEGGMARAERELVAFVESRINGCPYCVSHHSREFLAQGGDEALTEQILAEGPETVGTGTGHDALIRFGIRSTPPTPEYTGEDIEALAAAGYDDLALLDAIHVVGMFAWGNRLLMGLGEPVMPE